MYNKLFTKILDSSIWLENQPTRLVWITFIAMMDQDGAVALSSIGNVANRARVSLEEAEAAIHCLESPDAYNPDQDHEGRRIERIPGMGWTVLNAGKYRDIIKAETARAANRERVARHRSKKLGTPIISVTNCNDLVMQSEALAGSVAEAQSSSIGLIEDAASEKSEELRGWITKTKAKLPDVNPKVVEVGVLQTWIRRKDSPCPQPIKSYKYFLPEIDAVGAGFMSDTQMDGILQRRWQQI